MCYFDSFRKRVVNEAMCFFKPHFEAVHHFWGVSTFLSSLSLLTLYEYDLIPMGFLVSVTFPGLSVNWILALSGMI